MVAGRKSNKQIKLILLGKERLPIISDLLRTYPPPLLVDYKTLKFIEGYKFHHKGRCNEGEYLDNSTSKDTTADPDALGNSTF